MRKRFLALLLAVFVFTCSVVVPAFAVEALPSGTTPALPGGVPAGTVPGVNVNLNLAGFADWVYDKAQDNLAWIYNRLIDDSYCSASDNRKHNFVKQFTTVENNGRPGNYYICEHCGQSAGAIFEGWESSDNDGEKTPGAYNMFVINLPAQTITSDGRLRWQVTWSDFDSFWSVRDSTSAYGAVGQSSSGVYFYNVVLNPDGGFGYGSHSTSESTYFDFRPLDSTTMLWDVGYKNARYIASWDISSLQIRYPVTGIYSVDKTTLGAVTLVDRNCNVVTASNTWDCAPFSQSEGRVYFACNSSLGVNVPAGYYLSMRGVFRLPSFTIIPSSGLDITSGDTYNIDNRPTSITGNYGIVGDNGQITNVTNTSIVNETNNTYTNPATGIPMSITNWNYDYSTRSYTLDLDPTSVDLPSLNLPDIDLPSLSLPSKSTVTYGDTSITITDESTDNNGDTITNTYTVYYLIETGDSGDTPAPTPTPGTDIQPTPTPHVHNYAMATVPATCTLSGSKTYTCACGNSYAEVIPATGHNWQVKTQVPTEYSDDGQLVTQGYTIYRCSNCGEEYRDNDSTGPPANPGGGNTSLTWLDKLVKDAEEFRDFVVTLLKAIPDMMSGYIDFLRRTCPYLPEDVIKLLTFGVASMVVIAIIKAIRR